MRRIPLASKVAAGIAGAGLVASLVVTKLGLDAPSYATESKQIWFIATEHNRLLVDAEAVPAARRQAPCATRCTP